MGVGHATRSRPRCGGSPSSRGLVYFEVEERHFRGDNVNVVNSMTVFEFNDDGKIRHLDVYLQQAR